jgi:hypothetical protein
MKFRGGFVIALALVGGCGKEIGRVGLSGEGEGDTTVTVGANQQLALWTSLDASWDGTWAPSYVVELRDSSGKAVATTTCDPLTPTTRIKSIETHVGSRWTKSYSGKMQCDLVAPSAGTYTVHAKLGYATKPASLTVRDIGLVVKI